MNDWMEETRAQVEDSDPPRWYDGAIVAGVLIFNFVVLVAIGLAAVSVC